MTSQLIPAKPADVMVIRKVTDNITTFSAPFNRFGRFKIGGRGTAVRLPSGSVAVFSPTALTDEVKECVAAMGTVKYLTALDFEHHIYLGDWKHQYPDAKVIGPEGLPEKRDTLAKDPKQGIKLADFAHIWTAKDKLNLKVDQEFDDAFEYEYVDSHANKELVFNFKPEKTLIEADLIFNLPAIEQYSKSKENPHAGFATKIFTALQNTKGANPWQRKFIWYMASSGNRQSFNSSMARIDKWDFDRIIPCHGDVIETGGKGVFRKVLQWHLRAAEKEASS